MHNVYVHAIVVITIIISAYAVHKVGDIHVIILLSVEYRQCIYMYIKLEI